MIKEHLETMIAKLEAMKIFPSNSEIDITTDENGKIIMIMIDAYGYIPIWVVEREEKEIKEFFKSNP